MIKAFSYYALHSLINQVKKLVKTWVAIFIVCCFAAGFVFGTVFSKLEKEMSIDKLSQETVEVQEHSSFDDLLSDYHIERIEFVEIVCGVVILGIVLLIVLGSNKNGTAGFIPADVNILFTSPMTPQNVLLFRLFCQLGLMVVMTIYYLIEIPALMQLGLNLPSAITAIISLGLSCIFAILLNCLLFLLTSKKDRYKKLVNYLPFIIIGFIFVVTLVYSWITGIEFVQSAVNILSSRVTRYIPIIGWTKALPFIVLEGKYIIAVLVFALCIISIIILLRVIKRIKCDYYEDAIEKTEKILEKMDQAKKDGLFTAKSKKEKKEKKNLHFKGKGEYMFFSKQMYLRKKYAHLGIFTSYSYVFLAAGIISTLILLVLNVEINYIPTIVGLVYGIIAFYMTLKNPLLTDIKTIYFRLAPGNGWKKIFWSLFAGSVTCFLNMLPGIIVCDIIGIAFGGDVVSIITSSFAIIVFVTSLDFYSSNVGAFIHLSLPDNAGTTIKQVFQMLFLYFGLVPDVVLIVLCYNSLSPVILILLIVLLNMLIGFFFMAFLPLFLWPSSKEPIKYEKLVKEEDLKKESVNFSTIGLGLAIALVTTYLSQVVMIMIIKKANPSLLESELITWLVNFVPTYLIGIPLGYLIIRKIPIKKIEKKKLSLKFFIEAGIALFSLGYIVNIANRFVLFIFQVLGDFSIENVVESLVLNKTDWILVLVVVIVGPFIEELLFRKILIDRLNIYGGKLAIIVSAIMFGLFHGNVEQIPYAMALGLILGYVYQRSGNMLYSWILHMIFNLNGSIISLKIVESQNTTLIIAYELILLVIILVGIVVMAIRARELIYVETEKQLPKKSTLKTVLINPGMITMLIVCLILVVFNLVNMIR